ncbi:MAG: class A beta-lactamase-related serine hydrolase [Chitinophagaceae bacterium]|nr:MAG: class A beta-lactamase-related serine hydrolase [Chitinophagaceae bacterium]
MKALYLLALLLLTGNLFAQQASPQTRFDSLAKAYEQAGYHGVILVANKGTVLYEKGYGLANFENGTRHTPETVFKTESVGKMFTATAILQLVEKGKLQLTQTVRSLLPELAIRNSETITVEQLLKHTSGLQSPWDHPGWQFKKDYSRTELERIITEVPLAFDTPGKEMFYSNSGYYILGWIIEKLTGTAYDTYFQQQFFGPLKMHHTRHLNDTIMPAKGGAQPYQVISSKRYLPMGTTVGPKASPAGGWLSTAKDLYRFLLALSTGKLLQPKTLALMQTANGTVPKDSSFRFYAFGLETYQNQPIAGTALYGHNGGGAGFSIDAFVDKASGTIVTSCTNLYQNSRPIAMNFLSMALNKPVGPVSQSFTVKLYDLLDSIGMETFLQNEKDYFKQLGIQVHPGVFARFCDALRQAGDYGLCTKWMALARTYFPEEGYLWVLSGENELSTGNKSGARNYFLQAKAIGEKRNDQRVTSLAEEKLKMVSE